MLELSNISFQQSNQKKKIATQFNRNTKSRHHTRTHSAFFNQYLVRVQMTQVRLRLKQLYYFAAKIYYFGWQRTTIINSSLSGNKCNIINTSSILRCRILLVVMPGAPVYVRRRWSHTRNAIIPIWPYSTSNRCLVVCVSARFFFQSVSNSWSGACITSYTTWIRCVFSEADVFHKEFRRDVRSSHVFWFIW